MHCPYLLLWGQSIAPKAKDTGNAKAKPLG